MGQYTIRIVNLRNYVLEKGETLIGVDRKSIVGNPFFMNSEKERNLVCDKYDDYFNNQMVTNQKFKDFIDTIYRLSESGNIVLGCWCYPKRCHAETIKRYLEYLRQNNNR